MQFNLTVRLYYTRNLQLYWFKYAISINIIKSMIVLKIQRRKWLVWITVFENNSFAF